MISQQEIYSRLQDLCNRLKKGDTKQQTVKLFAESMHRLVKQKQIADYAVTVTRWGIDVAVQFENFGSFVFFNVKPKLILHT